MDNIVKDWTGNKKTQFVQLGATNHSKNERETHDYYATDPIAVKGLLGFEKFNNCILEPCCGEGHISKELENHGYNVTSEDLIYRGYGKGNLDFLIREDLFDGDIITNPPYKYAEDFVKKSLDIVKEGSKIAMFLRIQFLESNKRKKLFDKYPPKTVYVASNRIKCAINGDFQSVKSSASCYCWIIWEKGFKGNTILKWFN